MVEFSAVVTLEERSELGHLFAPLADAAKIEHNHGSLLAHLIGVWRVLRTAQVPAEIACAGLIHSVYSTQFFKPRLFEANERDNVARIYGENAELLAWLFCKIDRASLWPARPTGGFIEPVVAIDYETGDKLALNPGVANALFMLECANFIDQGYPDCPIGAFHAWALSLNTRGVNLHFPIERPITDFSEQSENDAIELYWSDYWVTSSVSDLECAAQKDPYAAEPLIVAAAIAISEGSYTTGLRALVRGRKRLPIFGTSWDKRLSYAEWDAISKALSCSAKNRQRHWTKVEPNDVFALRDWAIFER